MAIILQSQIRNNNISILISFEKIKLVIDVIGHNKSRILARTPHRSPRRFLRYLFLNRHRHLFNHRIPDLLICRGADISNVSALHFDAHDSELRQ